MASSPDKLFEVRYAGDEVLLRVHPPEGSQRASLTDIQRELAARHVRFDPDKMIGIHRRATNQFELLCRRDLDDYEIIVDVEPGAMLAHLTVTPPRNRSQKLDPATVKTALAEARISKGILYDTIRGVLRSGSTDGPVVIAQGKEKVDGEDATLRLVVPEVEDDDGGLEALADGNLDMKVDRRELLRLETVKAGDMIAVLEPPTRGEHGFTVKGDALMARSGAWTRVRAGKNVDVNEDGDEFFATQDGMVVVSGNKIAVEEVYEVTNVDGSTGNVRFNGVVRVRVNVEDGFTVESDVGIEVGGVVGRSMLRSMGGITVRGGVLGATLEAEGSVSAKFLSDARVRAGDSVTVEDYILHSTVEAGNVVQVTRGPKGFITGGVIRARSEVIAPVLGSEVSEDITRIQVGIGAEMRRQLDELQTGVAVHLESFDKLRKSLGFLKKHRLTQGPLDELKQKTFRKMLFASHKVRDDLLQEGQSLRRLVQDLNNRTEGGLVLVATLANSGAFIQIQREQFKVDSPLEACAFALENNQLQVMEYRKALKARATLRGR